MNYKMRLLEGENSTMRKTFGVRVSRPTLCMSWRLGRSTCFILGWEGVQFTIFLILIAVKMQSWFKIFVEICLGLELLWNDSSLSFVWKRLHSLFLAQACMSLLSKLHMWLGWYYFPALSFLSSVSKKANIEKSHFKETIWTT